MIEQIDIGGPAMVRASAKNHPNVAIVVSPARYGKIMEAVANGGTFGSRATLEIEAARVRALHERVRGSYIAADGNNRNYRASDSDLLSWVHVAFTDSFLSAHQVYGSTAVSADDYVRDWGAAVAPLGLASAPDSAAELEATIKRFQPQLRVDERTQRVVRFVQRAPLPRGAQPVFRLLFWAAVDTLPDEIRAALGLRKPPRRLVRASTRTLLRGMRFALGKTSPIESAALARIARLDDETQAHGKMPA